jgi:hypothetical protein
VLNESGGDNDTRIEGDTDPNLLFVDASTDRVGVGTDTPATKFDVNGTTTVKSLIVADGANGTAQFGSANTYTIVGGVDNEGLRYNVASGQKHQFRVNAQELMVLNSSGNLGLGVTPSAWDSTFKNIQIGGTGYSGSFYSQANGDISAGIVLNAYYDGGWKYTASSKAVTQYEQNNGVHKWLTAASGTAGNTITFGDAKMTLDASGELLIGKTTTAFSTKGIRLNGPFGQIETTADGTYGLAINRLTNDGDLVVFYQATALEGSISVSGNTVSYNAFAGSHWSQLQDGSKPDILRGTVMESINELCVWPDETNERLPKCKISDTAGSKKVYGVFMAWDNDWTETNDMLVTSIGAFVCRVNAGVTVQEGDLLESNGDGTARVQADDIIRSSTIGKVTSTVKTHEYDDGSYCVPTVLYCG